MSGHDDDKLTPPTVVSEDTGARQAESSDEDHFSDAHSDQDTSASTGPVRDIGDVEHASQHRKVSDTDEPDRSNGDTQLEEVIEVPNKEVEGDSAAQVFPSGVSIPTLVVQKVEPEIPRHGELPGTDAYEKRKADAVPDVVLSTSSQTSSESKVKIDNMPGDLPIPSTKVELVDGKPSHGEVPGTEAFRMRGEDAEPDEVEVVGDVQGWPTPGARSNSIEPETHNRKLVLVMQSQDVQEYNEDEDGQDEAEDDFGDDFDEFEEGDDATEFEDFEEGFQEQELTPQPQTSHSTHVFEISKLDSSASVMTAADQYVGSMFPEVDTISQTITPASVPGTTFLTERSASLWNQLIAPPPLSPPDWIRSRIRRLFLVSLGVPVDLDEILPASKQKKLVLPSTNLHSTSSPRSFTNLSRLAVSTKNDSTTSLDSNGATKATSKSSKTKQRGSPPAPELDILSARQLCSMTDFRLHSLTDAELRDHVKQLDALATLAQEVLDFWIKRTDAVLGEREAFEGVIENLVKHARKVRK